MAWTPFGLAGKSGKVVLAGKEAGHREYEVQGVVRDAVFWDAVTAAVCGLCCAAAVFLFLQIKSAGAGAYPVDS